jgi:hypothetical protein
MTRLRPGALSITPLNRYINAQVSSRRLPGATHRADTGCNRSRDRIPGRPVTMPRPDHCLWRTNARVQRYKLSDASARNLLRYNFHLKRGWKKIYFLVRLLLVIPMLKLRSSRPIFTRFGASVTQLDATSTSQSHYHHTGALSALTVTHARTHAHTHSCKMK